MNKLYAQFGKWFSPRFLEWCRMFLLFFVIYTLLALLLRHTLAYLIPFVIGLGIALASQPLIRLSTKYLKIHPLISSRVSPLLTILILLGIIGGLSFVGVRELVSLLSRIPDLDPRTILAALETWSQENSFLANMDNWFSEMGLPISLPTFDMNFINDNRDTILGILNQTLSYAGNAAMFVISIVTSLPLWITLFVVIIFSAFSFSKDYEKLKGYVWSLFSEHTLITLKKTWAHGLGMLGRYIRSYLLIYFITFLQTFVLFLLLKLDYPLIWSVLTGVSDIIPILGPGTIYVPMAVVQAVQGNWGTAAILIGGWIFITVVRQFVESKVVADSINIHPLFMLAVLFISFQAGSLYLLIYLTFMIIFYNLLKQSSMMPSLFDPPDVEKRLKQSRKFLRGRLKKIRHKTSDNPADETSQPLQKEADLNDTVESNPEEESTEET